MISAVICADDVYTMPIPEQFNDCLMQNKLSGKCVVVEAEQKLMI